MSQLDLACEAEVSTRHLSYVETGRAAPSREMLLRLAERLEVPLRERNQLLLAAGFAPMFRERRLDDPDLHAVRAAVERVLRAHEPYPALAVDRHWHLLMANRAVAPLLDGVAPELLRAPVNVLRLSLHPEGLAPRIVNIGEWRAHLLTRLHAQVAVSGAPTLAALMRELADYPLPTPCGSQPEADGAGIAVRMRLALPDGRQLSLLSTTTVFGTPVDVTLAELAIGAFLPTDAATAEALRGRAAA